MLMEKMKLTRLKKRMILICVLFSAIAVTLFIWASYINRVKVTGKAVLADFEVEIDDTAAGQVDESGVVKLSPAEYEALTLTVNKTGDGWAYVRVLIEESWMKYDPATETWRVIATAGGSLGVDTDVAAVGSNDEYVYVKGIVKGVDDIPILTDGNTLPNDFGVLSSSEDYQVKLSIKVEAIQYNRLEALWGANTPLSQ